MSGTQTVDYDALAKQYGAVSSQPAKIDYDALAKQHGATSSTKPEEKPADVPWYKQKVAEFKTAVSSPENYMQSVKDNAGQITKFASAVREDVRGALTSPSTYLGPSFGGGIDAAKKIYDMASGQMQPEPEFADRFGQSLGVNTQGVREAAQKGDLAGVLGHAAVPLATVLALSGNKPVAEIMKKAPGEVMKAPAKVATAVENLRPQGAQQTVVKSALNLPMKAVSGAEDIFRAAAPTGMNRGFRDNLYVAAPDLADIGRKIDLAEAKGGIVNPDMRVRATVDAISSHLDEMYQKERAPQIERNAAAPVSMHLSPDGVEGLQYMKRSAGEAETRAIAAKALEERTLTLDEANKLAMVANQNLKGFESMTAAERAQASMTNRRLGSLKALDKSLGREMNDVLTSSGEEGLRYYERRFAALSEVRDQLSTRMNATELKQPGIIKSLIKPIGAAVTGGPSGIASASQAAVSDVNIGKMLQGGFRKLVDSEISASSGRKSFVPRSQ